MRPLPPRGGPLPPHALLHKEEASDRLTLEQEVVKHKAKIEKLEKEVKELKDEKKPT